MIDAETMRKMAEWLGPDWKAPVYDHEKAAILWHVAERLELLPVGYRFVPFAGAWEWRRSNYIEDELHGPFPTKPAAVIAAWQHHTGASRP